MSTLYKPGDPVVYVVQRTMTRSGDGSTLVPKHDVSPAAEYGHLVYLLGPSASPFGTESVLEELRHKLQHYDGSRDYLLLVGNPTLIGWACAIAADASEVVRTLQWNGKDGRYVAVRAVVLPDEPEEEDRACSE